MKKNSFKKSVATYALGASLGVAGLLSPIFVSNFMPHAVVAAADEQVAFEWNGADKEFTIKVTNIGVGGQIKVKVTDHLQDFLDGKLTIYVGSLQVMPVNLDPQTGEFTITLTDFDSTPIAEMHYNVAGNIDAEFGITAQLFNQDGQSVTDEAKLEIKANADGTVEGEPTKVGTVPSKKGKSERRPGKSEPTAKSCTDSKPAATPELFQIDSNQGQAKLYWTPVEGVTDYVIAYSLTANGEEYGVTVKAHEPVIQEFTINDLSANTDYYFSVRGQNGCMPGDWSNTLSAFTKKTAQNAWTSYFRAQ